MKISDFSVNRPIAILMLILIVVLVGIVSWSRLNLDLYPDIKLPVAAVIISYPGAGPEEVESQVTRPVEEILGTIGNVKELYSYSRAGSSVVVCRFNWGTDMDFATLQMREKVDLVKRGLPEDIETPLVVKMDPSMMPVLQIGVTGGRDLVELKTLAEDEIKPALERVPGVASVTLTGGLEREVQVAVDPVKLQNYGLSLAQITQLLRAENFNQPGGEIRDASRILFVRNLGQFQSLEEIRSLPLTASSGSVVYLRDVAEVTDGYKDVTQKTRLNGRPSIGIHVLKQSDANTVKVAQEVKKELAALQQKLPQGIEAAYAFDQSEFIEKSLQSVKRHALAGALLAIGIIFLFLRSMRSTLIISVAIPFSIVATFILMYFSGITFNLVSMGGLALGIGRMVDDAIVVLESIYRYRVSGYGLKEAARLGAAEVGNAVMASTFTTIAVFFPIVFVEGISSIIFKQLAMTVSFAIFCSLVVALTLVPMLASKMLVVPQAVMAAAAAGAGAAGASAGGGSSRAGAAAGSSGGSGSAEGAGGAAGAGGGGEGGGVFGAAGAGGGGGDPENSGRSGAEAGAGEGPLPGCGEGGRWKRLRARLSGQVNRALERWGQFIDRLNEVYLRVLRWALSHRKTVVIGISLCLVASLGFIPLIGAEFLPTMDSGEISIDIQMDKGAVLERTDALTAQVEGILKQVPEVKTVFTSVGPSGSIMVSTGASQPDVSRLRVILVPRAERSRSVQEVADDIRRQVSSLPGAQIKVAVSDPMMAGMPTSTPISISIKGDDLGVLRSLAEEVASRVRSVPGTREVDTSLSSGYPEIQIFVDRQKASTYGITAAQVASTVKTAVEGQVATRYRTGAEEIDIRVRLKPEARENLKHLEDLTIPSPLGTAVRLADIARLERVLGPSVVNRQDQVRVVNVTGDLAGRDLSSVMKDIQARLADFRLPPGYSLEYGGSNKEMVESFQSLTNALLLAIVLVYMVMAIQYESLLYPFVIMFTMPTTVIGVVLGLVLTGRSFSVPAFIGLIMLAGIVVSNGIVLVDYINTLRARGMERTEAILTAGPVRLRPILMTALTTILAMFPLALGLGEGGENQAPMATVVIGGLTVSTFLTLVLIPVVYTLFDDVGVKIKARLKRRLTGEAA